MSAVKSVATTQSKPDPSIEDWKTIITSTDINAYVSNRTCTIIFGGEAAVESKFVLDRFAFGSQIDDRNEVKCLFYKYLLDDIQAALSVNLTDIIGSTSLIEQMFIYAVQENRKFTERKKYYPAPLMSYFIKFQILKIIDEDVLLEKIEIYKNQQLEKQRIELADLGGATKGGKGKKGGKDAGKGKGKDKKGKDKKGKGGTEADVCLTRLKLETSFGSRLQKRNKETKPLPLDTIQVPQKHLFIVILGFLDCNLFLSLMLIGVKITCFMEIYTPEAYKGRGRSVSDIMSTTEDENPEHRSSISSDLSLRNIYLGSYRFRLSRFWEKVNELFQSDSQYDYLEDTFHIRYITEDIVKTSQEEEFEKSSIETFQRMAAFVKKLPDVPRQHATYLQRMKLWNLGPKLNPMAWYCFGTYRRMLDKVPSECFTVALLLHCLIEEVCENSSESSYSEDRNQYTVNQESIPLKDTEETASPIPRPRYSFSDSARRQLVSVITRYTTIEKPHYEESVSYETYFPKSRLELVSKPFRVHEDNKLEIMLNFYGKTMANNLLQINMMALEQSIPILLLQEKYDVVDDTDKRTNEKNLNDWSKQLQLSRSDLATTIYLLLFGSYSKWKDNQVANEHNIEVADKFPRRTDSEYLACKEVHLVGSELSIPVEDISTKKLRNIQYYENLPDCVCLQQLQEAQNEFQCLLHKYVPLTDSLLLFFHNKFNKNGSYTEIFNQSLRTPLCIRDFCRFVVHEEETWLMEQERKYQTEMSELRKQAAKREDFFFPPMDIDELFYIQPGSIKDNLLKEDQLQGDGGKKGKGAGKDKKAAKGTAAKGKAGKGKDAKSAANIFQKYPQILPPPPEKRFSIRCAADGDPYDFIGYDLGDKRLQLTGCAITLNSEDGIQVVIDQTRWLGGKKNITVKVNAQNHYFILHVWEEYLKDNLLFHFSLSNDSVIVFAKPKEYAEVQNKLCEKIYRSILEEKTNKASGTTTTEKKPRQNIYILSEKQNCIVRAFRVPFFMERSIVLSESSFRIFLEKLQSMNVRIKLNPVKGQIVEEECTQGDLLNEQEKEEIEEDKDINRYFEVVGAPKLKVICPRAADVANAILSVSSSTALRKRPVRSLTLIPEPVKKNKLLEVLKTAKDLKYPVYRVCSSALHKNEYIKRVKSYVEIPIGNVVRRILVKPPFCKPQRTIEVSKCYPIILSDEKSKTVQSIYEVKSSLPSGLMITTIPGFNYAPFQIKQFYIDKGPLCKNVLNEEYRIFHEGNIIIKKCDGNFTILSVSGTKVDFEVPYFKKKENVKLQARPKKPACCYNYHVPLHVCTRSLTRMQKLVYKSILRKRMHLIDSPESRFYRSRKMLERLERKKLKQQKFFFVPSSTQPLTEFKILTPEGKQIRAKADKILKDRKLYVSNEADYNSEEIIFERQDGMQSLLNREGVLVTQFPDNSRIRSSILCDDKLHTAFDDEQCKPQEFAQCDLPSCRHMKEEKPKEEIPGWVLLSLQFEYFHPNYATVTYSNFDHSTTVKYPDQILLRFDGTRFSLNMSEKVTADVTDSVVQITSKICPICPCLSVCTVNIKPLYYQTSVDQQQLLNLHSIHESDYEVDYEGHCLETIPYIPQVEESEHCVHDFKEDAKLFVLNRNLSGVKFWDSKLLLRHKTNKDSSKSVEFFKQKPANDIRCLDFKCTVKKPYFEKFLWPYKERRLWLRKNRPRNLNDESTAYVTSRIVYVLPGLKALGPLRDAVLRVTQTSVNANDLACLLQTLMNMTVAKDVPNIEQMKEDLGLIVKKVEDDVKKPVVTEDIKERRKVKRYLSTEAVGKISIDLPRVSKMKECETEAEKPFEKPTTFYEKWYLWHFRYKCYDTHIKERYVPPYFLSKYCTYSPRPKRKKRHEIVEFCKVIVPPKLEKLLDKQLITPKRSIPSPKSKSTETMVQLIQENSRVCSSDSSLARIKENESKLKQKRGVPTKDQYNNQKVVICNVVTVNADEKMSLFCGDQATTAAAPPPKQEQLEESKKCPENKVCGYTNMMEEPNQEGSAEDPSAIAGTSADNEDDGDVIHQLMRFLKDTIAIERNETLKRDPEEPDECKYKRSLAFSNKAAEFIAKLVKAGEDVKVSFSKASLFQSILKEIDNLDLTKSEADFFIASLDEELEKRADILYFQEDVSVSFTPSKSSEEEPSAADKDETVGKHVFVEERLPEGYRKESIQLQKIQVKDTKRISGSKTCTVLEEVDKTVTTMGSRTTPSLKLFYDIKSLNLLEKQAEEEEEDKGKTQKKLKMLKEVIGQRKHRDRPIHLSTILRKLPEVANMLPESESFEALGLGEQEAESASSVYEEKTIEEIFSHVTSELLEDEQMKAATDSTQNTQVQASNVSFPSIRRYRSSEDRSSTSRVSSTEHSQCLKAAMKGDYEKIDDLIKLPAISDSKSKDLPTKIVGGVFAKVTDNERERLMTNCVRQASSENVVMCPAVKVRRPPDIRGCVGTQTQYGRQDEESQVPEV